MQMCIFLTYNWRVIKHSLLGLGYGFVGGVQD